MIPVTQTKMVVRNQAGEMVVRGNCWAAAIASMLEVPISEVPNAEVFFDATGKHNDVPRLCHGSPDRDTLLL